MFPPWFASGEDVPDADALAYRLVARESPLDRAVLHELIGRPKRYAELKPLLGDKNDHNLTVALKRLQDWGLIERRTDARQEPVVHAYELTPLGIQVVLTIPAIQPIHESMDRYQRARMQIALADLRSLFPEKHPSPGTYLNLAGGVAWSAIAAGIIPASPAPLGDAGGSAAPHALSFEDRASSTGDVLAFDLAPPAAPRPEPALEEFTQKKTRPGKPGR